MRITSMQFSRSTLILLLLAPVIGAAAPKANPADMAVPMPTAPPAPPARVEPALPGTATPAPSQSGAASGVSGESAEPEGNPVRTRKLPDDAAERGSRRDSSEQTASARPQSANGVRWVCGGIGLDESARMKQDAKNYALMLSFSARDGSYLADVKVRVVDARGRPVLETSCDGPILLLDPPGAGTYRITARSGGTTLTRSATISAGQHGKSIAMVWTDRPSRSTGDGGVSADPSESAR
ncbi:MAG: putative exported protein [Herminiimonas sp.]|nr:putative exported protein [Herminiimonas sp.]MDB5852346.1 putative exported protein [Herminiimonas sp.]